jgi:ribosomal protein S18 acetylase RimI-like enzyme
MAAIPATIKDVAVSAEIDRTVATLTLAFSTDPIARWIYDDDPHRYLTHFPDFVRAFGGKAFPAGTAYEVKDGVGAALWLPPGVHIDDETLGAVLERTLSPEKSAAIGAVFGQMAEYHPHKQHWYLPLIGIDSLHQNKGYGSVLLDHTLRQCDRDHVAAYLESTNPRNIPFYERHGFEVLGTIVVDFSCSISPMLRRAR